MKINIIEQKFANNIIFSDVSLEIKDNGCYAILGKNGTGKTTLFKIISGLILNYKGETIFASEEKIASLIDGYGFIPSLTGYQMIDLLLDNVEKQNFFALAQFFKVNEYLNKKIGDYSLGMRKKYSLCFAFSRNAKIVILDEPFNGLDDEGRDLLKAKLNEQKKDKIILVSTHLFNDLATYSDKILLISNKKIIEQDFYSNCFAIEFKDATEKQRFIDSTSFVLKEKGNSVIVYIENEKEIKPFKKKLAEYEWTSFESVDYKYQEEE